MAPQNVDDAHDTNSSDPGPPRWTGADQRRDKDDLAFELVLGRRVDDVGITEWRRCDGRPLHADNTISNVVASTLATSSDTRRLRSLQGTPKHVVGATRIDVGLISPHLTSRVLVMERRRRRLRVLT